MAVASSQKSVSTATLLSTAPSSARWPGDGGRDSSILATNRHATVSVYLGPSGVDSTGYEIKAGESVSIDLYPGESIYAVAASGTVTVHVLEVGI